jgi:hypothetical protein
VVNGRDAFEERKFGATVRQRLFGGLRRQVASFTESGTWESLNLPPQSLTRHTATSLDGRDGEPLARGCEVSETGQ